MAQQTFLTAAEMKAAGYIGPPLPDQRHIRLLELPTTTNEAGSVGFEFSWRTVSIDRAEGYTALSYTWGGAAELETIRLFQGFRFTQNLFLWLVQVAIMKPGPWWVDALCINQEDPQEKANQVQMMQEIYTRAAEVFAFIGPGDENSRLAIPLSQTIWTRMQEGRIEWEKYSLSDKDIYSRTVNTFSERELLRLDLPPPNSPQWPAFVRFLKDPYFGRIWVLQELVMGMVQMGNVTVRCGSEEFPLSVFVKAAVWMRKIGWETLILENEEAKHGSIVNFRDDYGVGADLLTLVPLMTMSYRDKQEETRTLGWLLDLCRNLKATNPKDKVIALLGLAGPADKAGRSIIPRYDQSDAHFFRDVTGHMITVGQSLDLLSAVEDNSLRRMAGLPSWVPDFSIENWSQRASLGYSASKGSPIQIKWDYDSNVLQTRALMIDEIYVTASARFHPGSDIDSTVEDWFKIASDSVGASSNSWVTVSQQPEYEDYVYRFWRTIFRPRVTKEYKSGLDNYTRESPMDDYQGYALLFMWKILHDNPEYVLPPMAQWLAGEDDKGAKISTTGYRQFQEAFMRHCTHSVFFVTKTGRFGVGPASLQEKDTIAILSGAPQLFILRKVKGQKQQVQLVGCGYVEGLMYGEALKASGAEFEPIEII